MWLPSSFLCGDVVAEGKRYFWLRLHDDFFRSVRIKKLRRMAGGDTYVIIYLKMQLKAMKTDGVLTWRGYEQDFVDELAIDLDEEPDNVRVTLAYLLSCGLAETEDKVNFFLPYAVENTGSETASTQRWREWKNRKVLESNTTPTFPQQNANVEIEKEKDIEIEKDSVRAKRFTQPTLEEVKAYCKERGNHVDAERWFNYYTSNGWKVGKNQMKDWKAAVRTWERDDKAKTGAKINPPYDGLRSQTSGDDADRLLRQLGVDR